jgi:hypothetical protein
MREEVVVAIIRSLRQWVLDERVNSFDDSYIGQT